MARGETRASNRVRSAAAALALMVGTAGAWAQDVVKLTVGTSWPQGYPLSHMLTDQLKPKLDSYSKGKVKLEVHLANTLCSETTCVEQVKLGQADIGTISVANYGGFGKTFEILTLPYIFKDTESARKVMDGFLLADLRQRAERAEGIKVLAIVPMFGFRSLENNRGVIRTPADMKGVKFRVTKSPLDGALIDAWGGSPTPVPWPETYDSLQQKVVQGIYIQKGVWAGLKFLEVTPYVTDVGGAWTPMMLFMDLKRFQKLSPDAQAAINKAADELQQSSWQIDAEYMAKFEAKAAAAGNKVQFYKPTPDEMKQWRQAAAKSWLIGKKMGLYNADLARKVLKAQEGQGDMIAELEKLGAL